jgi:hypothetical protein
LRPRIWPFDQLTEAVPAGKEEVTNGHGVGMFTSWCGMAVTETRSSRWRSESQAGGEWWKERIPRRNDSNFGRLRSPAGLAGGI